MKIPVSAVILAKNEEKNISRVINSLLWCDEIIIIDDLSTDGTISEINKFNNIKIFKRPLDNDFSASRNFGLAKAKNSWVLFIDADEVISESLKKEILEKLKDDCDGFYLRRKDFFLGSWLEFGETAAVKLLRLAKKDKGRWIGKVHEIWRIDGQTGNLTNPILHYSHENISSFLEKINRYSSLVAQYRIEEGRKTTVFQITTYPLFKFINNYFFKLGFMDSVPGFIMAAMMSFHSFLVQGKVYLKRKK